MMDSIKPSFSYKTLAEQQKERRQKNIVIVENLIDSSKKLRSEMHKTKERFNRYFHWITVHVETKTKVATNKKSFAAQLSKWLKNKLNNLAEVLFDTSNKSIRRMRKETILFKTEIKRIAVVIKELKELKAEIIKKQEDYLLDQRIVDYYANEIQRIINWTTSQERAFIVSIYDPDCQ